MREQALEIYKSAVEAVQPQRLMEGSLRRLGPILQAGNQSWERAALDRVLVIAVGKAASAMAMSAREVLGDWITEGFIMTKYGHGFQVPGMMIMESGHPVPDAAGIRAAAELQRLIQKAGADDLVILLLSGGASALIHDPAPPITPGAMARLTEHLLRAGADIHETNAVRKHLSFLKGGQFARSCRPAKLVCLAISDVAGDDATTIGSGPSVPDPSTFADAWHVLEKYELIHQVDEQILIRLQEGLSGRIAETPKPGDPVFSGTGFHLLGSNQVALEAAAQRARVQGKVVSVKAGVLTDDVSRLAQWLAATPDHHKTGDPNCIIMGGEPTLAVKGIGKGGRCQELALQVLHRWYQEGRDPRTLPTLLVGATDGTDGPTDAAGAVVDGRLLAWVRATGLSSRAYLDRNDSYHFFAQTDGHLKTGPTQTNVMDIAILLWP